MARLGPVRSPLPPPPPPPSGKLNLVGLGECANWDYRGDKAVDYDRRVAEVLTVVRREGMTVLNPRPLLHRGNFNGTHLDGPPASITCLTRILSRASNALKIRGLAGMGRAAFLTGLNQGTLIRSWDSKRLLPADTATHDDDLPPGASAPARDPVTLGHCSSIIHGPHGNPHPSTRAGHPMGRVWVRIAAGACRWPRFSGRGTV